MSVAGVYCLVCVRLLYEVLNMVPEGEDADMNMGDLIKCVQSLSEVKAPARDLSDKLEQMNQPRKGMKSPNS